MSEIQNFGPKIFRLFSQAFKDFFLQSSWIPLALSFIALFGGLAPAMAYLEPKTNIKLPIILVSVSSIVGLLALFIVFRTINESRRLRKSFLELHAISHLMRDRIGGVLSQPEASTELGLAQAQQDATATCRLTARLFDRLIGCDCYVSVSLVTGDTSKAPHAFVWARSDFDYRRDESMPRLQRVENNTSLLKVLQSTSESRRFFHSPDLMREDKYFDDAPHWQDYYNSVIVVPIRCRSNESEVLFGFLKLETKSTYRLNDTFHVEILATVADQLAALLTASRTPIERIVLSTQKISTK